MCDKVKFITWDEAADAVLNAKIMRWKYGSSRTKRREDRVYFCFDCKAHHITSQPDLRKKEAS